MGFFSKALGSLMGDDTAEGLLGAAAGMVTRKVAEEAVDRATDAAVSKAADALVGKKGQKDALSVPAPPPVPETVEKTISVMVAVNGQQYGPYERGTLIEMIGSGALTRDTYVFMEGMTEWRFAREVPEVAILFGAPAVPAPPVPFAPDAPAVPQAPVADTGMSPKLIALIDAAVADGEITDLERQVLIRNAQAEGVSMDEFVVHLEARIFEQRKKIEAEQEAKRIEQMKAQAAAMGAHQTAAPKSFGAVRKCPACGAIIESVTAVRCSACGYELALGNSADPLQPLKDGLKELDDKLAAMNPFAQMFGQEGILKSKANVISTFSVPNSRNALIDFMLMAAAAVKACKFGDPTKAAWKGKAEEVVTRARMMHKDDAELMEIIKVPAKQIGIKIK